MPLESSGTVSVPPTENMANLTNGAGILDNMVLRTRKTMRYGAGQGCICRMSGLFGTPLTGLNQSMGLGNQDSEIVIGYTGTDFGVSFETGGVHELQQLTITSVASATTGTVIVTIGGMDYTINISDVSTTTIVAKQIAQINYFVNAYISEYIDSTVLWGNVGNATEPQGGFTFALGTAT